MNFKLSRSHRAYKKWMVEIDGHTVHFGDSRYKDFTQHHDPARKEKYIKRHAARENWNASGKYTAGFWSRWLLWNKPTIEESADYIRKNF